MKNPDIIIRNAVTEKDFSAGRDLFLHYAASLKIDLCFQGFDEELKIISVQYNQPSGVLLLAFDGDVAVGCTGLRCFENDSAELKRMYVLPAYQGKNIGKLLLKHAIDEAKKLGYKKILLDTLEEMIPARTLYKSFGFYEITSYYHNPLDGVVYMEKQV
ncbi:MAG: GNAT family N-acetyltransferase [Bacteroidota bacterium]